MTPRQQEIIDKMKPGEWYSLEELGTAQKLMTQLKQKGLVKTKDNPQQRSYHYGGRLYART